MAGELCVVLGTPHTLDLHPWVMGTPPDGGEPPIPASTGRWNPRVMGTPQVMGIPPGYLGLPG